MTSRAQTVLQEAMLLPADERRDVAAELAASLLGRTAVAQDASESWGSYLDDGPVASTEFMTNVEDEPTQNR